MAVIGGFAFFGGLFILMKSRRKDDKKCGCILAAVGLLILLVSGA